MKVVVTGATGHIGRYTVEVLARSGHEVVAVSRSGRVPALPFGVKQAPAGVRPLALDVAQDSAIATLESELGPDVALVHLAAWHPPATAATTWKDRPALIEANVYGTMRVLDAARRTRRGVRNVVYASTFEVYGELETPGAVSEDTRVSPLTDYGATKLSGEDHLMSFGYEEKTRVAALRMPAVYGPGEQTPRALPNFLKQVAQGERPTIHGDGLDQRDQLHARDAALAIERALTTETAGIFCIADGEPHTIGELARLALEVSGLGGDPTLLPRQKARRDYHMSIAKARRELGFSPSVTLRAGMLEQLQSLRAP